ncbi:MAG TPA: hypothetical protein VMB77_08785 [Syntrophales bacterium]|nr:hypothetical protein [Syntrophales bacterium]
MLIRLEQSITQNAAITKPVRTPGDAMRMRKVFDLFLRGNQEIGQAGV